MRSHDVAQFEKFEPASDSWENEGGSLYAKGSRVPRLVVGGFILDDRVFTTFSEAVIRMLRLPMAARL